MTTREQQRMRKLINKKAHAIAAAERDAVESVIPLDAYRDIPVHHLPPGQANGYDLKTRRGDLSDEGCIYRVCELVACGVTLGRARQHIGVPHVMWGEWSRVNLHNINQCLSFARLVRLETMKDEIFDIVDDPTLMQPLVELREAHDENGNVTTKPVIVATVQEKVRVAEMRVRARQWHLEKLAPEFTPRQMQMVQSISAHVKLGELSPQDAMERYQQILNSRPTG